MLSLLINKLFSINKSLFTFTLITISYYYTQATPESSPENCQANVIKLNDEQIIVYYKILQSVNNEDGQFKMINLLLAKEHISVTSSVIAATLLLNCRTAHSIYKIPIQINEDSICSIKNNSKSGKLFRSCTFIVWEESTMTHTHALEAVDSMVRDIVNKDSRWEDIH